MSSIILVLLELKNEILIFMCTSLCVKNVIHIVHELLLMTMIVIVMSE
jgi:hypothetical protein